jgi:hypothetical protein
VRILVQSTGACFLPCICGRCYVANPLLHFRPLPIRRLFEPVRALPDCNLLVRQSRQQPRSYCSVHTSGMCGSSDGPTGVQSLARSYIHAWTSVQSRKTYYTSIEADDVRLKSMATAWRNVHNDKPFTATTSDVLNAAVWVVSLEMKFGSFVIHSSTKVSIVVFNPAVCARDNDGAQMASICVRSGCAVYDITMPLDVSHKQPTPTIHQMKMTPTVALAGVGD